MIDDIVIVDHGSGPEQSRFGVSPAVYCTFERNIATCCDIAHGTVEVLNRASEYIYSTGVCYPGDIGNRRRTVLPRSSR